MAGDEVISAYKRSLKRTNVDRRSFLEHSRNGLALGFYGEEVAQNERTESGKGLLRIVFDILSAIVSKSVNGMIHIKESK